MGWYLLYKNVINMKIKRIYVQVNKLTTIIVLIPEVYYLCQCCPLRMLNGGLKLVERRIYTTVQWWPRDIPAAAFIYDTVFEGL
ncbi:hypothetical protein C0J52_12455 [Blattella germanica]|nr:hypothetical protein C0J52_12455 [Blattella germanica]